MIKILFVCHGNICRSPMAEFIMKDLVKKAGLEKQFLIESAAVSAEELGNPVYAPAKRVLAARGIGCAGKRAQLIAESDYKRYDLIIGMDRSNMRWMQRIFGSDPGEKLNLLLDWTDNPHDVADPWYTDDFETTERDIDEGCSALLEKLIRSGRV